MPILVTGASGFVGRRLTHRLLEGGEEVRILTRSLDRVPLEWRGKLDVVEGDVVDPAAQERALKRVSTVFNLAGAIHDVAAMRAVNVDAVRLMLDIAIRSGVEKIVHLSSVGVVGATGRRTVTEEAPCQPKSEYERTKLRGEELVLEAGRSGNVGVVVIRPTTIFGEGTSPLRDSLLGWLRTVQRGQFRFIGHNGIANYVYVEDVADVVLRLAAIRDLPSPLWHVADPTPMRDFVAAMADSLGVPAPDRSLPLWGAYAVGTVLELANRLAGTPAPLTRSRVRALSSETAYSGQKLASVGVDAQFGYRLGLQRTVEWYRSIGRLP